MGHAGKGGAGRFRIRLATTLSVLLAMPLVASSSAQGVTDCDPPQPNTVACENTKPGSPASEWDVTGAGDPAIQGFTSEISVDQGEVVRFKVSTPATAYRLDIYRMGYYGGAGARKIVTILPSVALPQAQPACLTQSSTRLLDCGNWAVSANWPVPIDAVSGIYFAKLVRTDGTAGASHVVFVVRDDDGASDLLFQTSDTTWQAYNRYGGNSLYTGPGGRAYKVSYNRPFTTRATSPEDWVFNAEYPMVRFLEANGYDVSYTTGVDTDRRGALLAGHKAFLSVGHDEYWSGQQRTNVEAARNAGVHLAFFSGNEIFWKARWEASVDGTGTPFRTLVSYKETLANQPIDPADPPIWTGTWRDPRFSPPADGGRPENALTGTSFKVNSGTRRITALGEHAGLRFWRGTRVAGLASGGSTLLGTGTLGYEWDEDIDNGSRPPGLMKLSSTVASNVQVLQDYGSTYASGTATHNLTLYRHPSGALVFGAGTVQWSWGLDANHDRGSGAADVAMQQATVNLLADMGSQPVTLQPGLVLATASSDTTAPTSVISAPAEGTTVQTGTAVTVTGTAADAGGGRVGGVEVSLDGGQTWHPAAGRERWSYPWTPTTAGTTTLRSRAVDDSGRLESPSTGVTVTVSEDAPPPPPPPPPVTCPCSIWTDADTPVNAAEPDSKAIEVGVKFRADRDGVVTAIRFYKGTGNDGAHVGHLWTSGGTLLGTATFSGETATGWQQASLASPVPITAGTTYVASYYAPRGRYAEDERFFTAAGVTRGPLTALANGVDGPNGVYRYVTGGGFPTNTYRESNYWVDVVFAESASGEDTTPPTVTQTAPTAGATDVATTSTVAATFSEPVDPASITFTVTKPDGSALAGSTGYDESTRTARFTPAAPLAQSTTYTASVRGARDAAGNVMVPVDWSFTTAGGTVIGCPCSIWPASATPGVVSSADTRAVELGVKFRASADGSITGVRFYKGQFNTGTHLGRLWSRDGTLLASATFTGESATGWQTVSFAAPVPVSAGVTYIASYYAPRGRYASDTGFFATKGVTNGPLTALQEGVDGSNGVYRYATGGGFPASTYKSTNYWVDVVYATGS